MASDSLFLTIDWGTQSVRVGLFDKEGRQVAMEKETYDPPYFSLHPNYAEQEAGRYFEYFAMASRRLAEKNGPLFDRVVGATVSCFRDTAVLLDKDRRPLRPSILWLDQRMADCRKKLPFLSRLAFGLVGMSDTANYNRARSASNWIQEHEPDVWARVDKYVNISTYMVYLLTGNLRDSASAFAGHYPIDMKRQRWYKDPEHHLKGQIFGLRADQLPELVPSGSVFGNITHEASVLTGIPEGLPLYAAGSDKSCETLGLGVIDETVAAISYGTASTVETTLDRYVVSERFLPGYPSAVPGYYNMDIQVYRGYWMINWFLKEFGGTVRAGDMLEAPSAADFDKKLPQVPPGSDGLVLQPYWGPPLSRPLAKGAIIGFSDSITQEHFYRAIVEGIAYALREGLEKFERRLRKRIPALRVSGGGSRSDEICQITADILGKPVTRVQTYESSSLGAAIAGFLAAGEFHGLREAVNSMVETRDSFFPNPRAKERYDYLYEHAYLRLYPCLKGIYKDIKDFNLKEERERLREEEGE